MYKKWFAAIALLLIFIPVSVFASEAGYDLNGKVRVGLSYRYKSVSTVLISNTDIMVGVQMGGDFVPLAGLSSAQAFSMEASAMYFVQLGQSRYASYTEARTAADSYIEQGRDVSPVLMEGNLWAVYTKGYPQRADAVSVANVLQGTVIEPSNTRSVLVSGGVNQIVFENSDGFAQIKSIGNTTTLGDRSYRGVIEFFMQEGRLTAVNVLAMDEYLYGVVPSEMPQAWHIEALKAQAVAARTYALSSAGSHTTAGYSLCDDVHCQVYKGAGAEAESTNRAVDQTSGVAIYYHDMLINATFFASSGGVTENSEGIWSNALPYLRSVTDIGEYANTAWTQAFTLAELTTILAANNVNIGTATGMKIISYTESGRVKELQITATAGTKVLTKGEIRSFFAPIATLKSTNFQIVSGTTVLDEFVVIKAALSAAKKSVNSLTLLAAGDHVTANANKTITVLGESGAKDYIPAKTISADSTNGILLVGSGNGHGVGFSQEGARGMGELGYNYIEILMHYYTGVVVK